MIVQLGLTNQEYQIYCRQYSAVEETLESYYSELGSAIPREVLRDLLTESFSSSEFTSQLRLQGSRLNICRLQEGLWLCAHTTGAIHHIPTVTVLRSEAQLSSFKVGTSELDLHITLTNSSQQ